MTPPTAPLQFLQAFRQKLLSVFPMRADALFELVDALLLTVDPRSPVELSASPAFRRRFSMVYDALRQGQIDPAAARELLAEAEPAEAMTVAGYAVYATDGTVHPRPDADTLPDRGQVYSTSQGRTVPGHQYNWLGRIVAHGRSWFAPRDVERIATRTTPAAVAAEQVKRLALTLALGALAVVVADSGYANAVFLAAFVGLTGVFALVRVANNRVLYGPPPPVERDPLTGKRRKKGRPTLHGAKFRLAAPPPPERQATFPLLTANVRVSAWGTLHFKTLPALVGTLLRVEFLRADGQPKYKRPLWLFWSGPNDLELAALVQMYLLRFGIEHFFRFVKQRLGLTGAQSPTLTACENWVWTVAFAYTHLVLARQLVIPQARAWDPKARRDPARPLTPGQVKQAWAIFSRGLGTPAAAPRPGGKAPGRAAGFHPQPRPKCPVVSKKAQKAAGAVA